jgi:hypothetical protein
MSDRPALEEEGCERLGDARRQKTPFERNMREGYFFAAPHRARSVLSTTRISENKPQDEGELNMSFAMEVSADFPTVIINTFLPEATPWAVRAAGWGIPDEVKSQANKLASDGTDTIFKAISASNFYAECGKGFTPDLALGIAALWIKEGTGVQPIHCQAIPIRELELNLNADGEVDDRFVVRWIKARHLKVVLKGVSLPADIAALVDKDPQQAVSVVWGFWRLYDDAGDEQWQHVVLVNDKLVNSSVLKGVGSCPLVVGRFNPSPEWAWGVGPLIQALPDLRHLDELVGAKIENLDQSLRPAITFPDDSFVNIEEGIEGGKAYPVRPGTAADVRNIYTPNPPDAAIYDRQDIEQRIKRLFFLDWPEQRGDTPPTATQWLDQMTMAQRRIGTPGLPFWREFCAGSFLRFQYLLEKAGAIQPVKVNGKVITLLPYNPAQKAADQQDVAMALRYLGSVGPLFPEEFKVRIDGGKTMDNIAKLMGVEKIVVERSADDVKAALAQIQGLAQSQAPAGAAPAPADNGAPPQNLAGPPPAQPQTQIRGRS